MLEDYLLASAEKGVILQAPDGAMPAGINGPWENRQTPVRNTAHWAVLFLKAYKTAGNSLFLESALKCYKYILSREARPFGHAYYCIDDRGSMSGNGLIGQAWIMESLLKGYQALADARLLREAEDLYKKHRFCRNSGLYHVLSVDGEIQKTHSVFNQQLWFAAMGAKLHYLTDGDNTGNDVFFGKFWDIMNSGRRIPFLQKVKSAPNKSLGGIWNSWTDRFFRGLGYRSAGYFSFVLHGLAELKKHTAENPFWNSQKWEYFLHGRILKFVYSRQYFNKCKDNKYAFGYNPCGFEIPHFLKTFDAKMDDRFIKYQLEKHWNAESGLLEKNTVDPETLAARMYEATYIME